MSFAGFGNTLVSEPGLADRRAPHPQSKVVEVEIDHGGRVEGQQLADQQSADDRGVASDTAAPICDHQRASSRAVDRSR